MTKPIMSASFSDLHKRPSYADFLKIGQPRSAMWCIGGEQPSKSGAVHTYELCPKSWVVLRLILGEESFKQEHLSDWVDVVDRWMQMIRNHAPFIVDPKRTIVCGPFNEFNVNESPWRNQLILMEELLCRRTWEELGIRSMVGNFSVGTPDVTWFTTQYARVLRAANRYHGVLGLHQYFQVYASDAAIHTSCRYENLLPLWREDPSTRVPVMSTETGVEDIFNRVDQITTLQALTGGIRTPGWRTAEPAYRFRGDTRPLRTIVVGEAKNLDTLHRRQNYVKADYWFYGTNETKWENYDPEELLGDLAAWIGKEQSTGLTSLEPDDPLDAPIVEVPGPTPEPEPEPIPIPDPAGIVAVKTICVEGQYIRDHPSYKGRPVGELAPGETAFVSLDQRLSIGQDYTGKDKSWVYAKKAGCEGWMAVWLLKQVA
jgi:hypothetical protein